MQEPSKRRSNRDRTEATRAALIGAARALFVEKGYAETGTPEIVTAAAVTRGALYHHFADKTDLFRAVAVEEARAVAREIETGAVPAASPRDAILMGTDAYFSAMSVPGRARLLLIETPAVLPLPEVADLHRLSGAEELRAGLAAVLAETDDTVLGALADVLSAGFDRAALAIASGAPVDPYRTAMDRILEGLISPRKATAP